MGFSYTLFWVIMIFAWIVIPIRIAITCNNSKYESFIIETSCLDVLLAVKSTASTQGYGCQHIIMNHYIIIWRNRWLFGTNTIHYIIYSKLPSYICITKRLHHNYKYIIINTPTVNPTDILTREITHYLHTDISYL